MRFPVVPNTTPEAWSSWKENLYVLSWTTTPWSLAANRAIAYKPDAQYVLVQDVSGNKYIVAHDLFTTSDNFSEVLDGAQILAKFQAEEVFKELKYQHPLNNEIVMSMFPGEFFTLFNSYYMRFPFFNVSQSKDQL